MKKGTLSEIFRNRIDEGIYNFDLVIVFEETFISSLCGYCIVNTKTDYIVLGVNESVKIVQEEIDALEKRILKDAKQLEKIIFS